MIVLPVLIGMYEARYALPALPLICMAAALSLTRVLPAQPRHDHEVGGAKSRRS